MRIIGVDEAGRGPLAGPVVAGAVVLPPRYRNPDIRDSKQLTAAVREELADEIRRVALSWSVVAVGHRRIDTLNIREATRVAMALAVDRVEGDMVLIDGNVPIATKLPQRTVIDGDRLHVQISAASILAKVYRDWLMVLLDRKFPQYGFSSHCGYATHDHRARVEYFGPCRAHRVTFTGVREFLEQRGALPFPRSCPDLDRTDLVVRESWRGGARRKAA